VCGSTVPVCDTGFLGLGTPTCKFP
jgi:hypothetical protein